jgi:hypothetical protein
MVLRFILLTTLTFAAIYSGEGKKPYIIVNNDKQLQKTKKTLTIPVALGDKQVQITSSIYEFFRCRYLNVKEIFQKLKEQGFISTINNILTITWKNRHILKKITIEEHAINTISDIPLLPVKNIEIATISLEAIK